MEFHLSSLFKHTQVNQGLASCKWWIVMYYMLIACEHGYKIILNKNISTARIFPNTLQNIN